MPARELCGYACAEFDYNATSHVMQIWDLTTGKLKHTAKKAAPKVRCEAREEQLTCTTCTYQQMWYQQPEHMALDQCMLSWQSICRSRENYIGVRVPANCPVTLTFPGCRARWTTFHRRGAVWHGHQMAAWWPCPGTSTTWCATSA